MSGGSDQDAASCSSFRSQMTSEIISSDQQETQKRVICSVDLVAAARRNLGVLRLVAHFPWLHHEPTILQSIRRYDELWMPLLSDLTNGSSSSKPPMILPPLDIEWVWFCHSLNPASYRGYCESKFSKLIGKPTLFDEENEEYALTRCKEIWVSRYPSEPFETDESSDFDHSQNPFSILHQQLLNEIWKQRNLYTKFSEPYTSEMVYLIAARQRYKRFLHLMQKYGESCCVLVPTSDVLLMWITHQSYPTQYATDTKGMEEGLGKVLGAWEVVEEKQAEETKKLWERVFDQPYEKAGGATIGRSIGIKPPFYWDVTDLDVNTNYKSMLARFVIEVCLSVKLNPKASMTQGDMSKEFLRLRMVRCHKMLKLDKPLLDFNSSSWQKAWHLYCEFGTKGVNLELRLRGGHCFKGSNLEKSMKFSWNDLLRAPSLTFGQEFNEKIRIVASITPPSQAPYLLKCVPDRVTDDSGAMISDVVLRMNQYHPQEGRWLSRTVLDHAGRECFVVRMRVGGGFWRRGGETPTAVKWEDRIIEIREGSWAYLAGSIGSAPEKVVGTATPKEPQNGWQSSWTLSTGGELVVGLRSSTSGLSFDLIDEQSNDSSVKLLEGRRMQYDKKKQTSAVRQIEHIEAEEIEDAEEDKAEGFLTLVRIREDYPNGRATALINWKLLTMEVLPEEDAVLVLLLCMAIVRSISEMTKEDAGGLLVRRRIKEAKLGDRDWGSVILHPSSSSISSQSPSSLYLQPWYWDPRAVMASEGTDYVVKQPLTSSSQAEGSDKLYKTGIFIA